MKKEVWKIALRESLPLLLSYVFIAIAFGITMSDAGYPWYLSLLSSVALYTGAYQFVLVSLMAGGASLVTVAVTALLMNSRQMFYALSFVDEFRSMGKRLPLMVHTLTDETYAVDCSLPRDLPERKNVLFLVAVLSYAYWILGTLMGAALGMMTDAGRSAMLNPGPHGFSEVLYAVSSAANNNGSAFAGLSANSPFWNCLLAFCMFVGRFGVIIPVMAIAGSLVSKKSQPASSGTLPTHGPLFVGLLIGTVLLVGALTFIPALALGPVAEYLS